MVTARSSSSILLVALAAACTTVERNGTPDAGPPVAVVAVNGMGQEAIVGHALPNAIVVRVVDAEDHPVSGQVVNFVVTAGGGHVFAGVAITNANGLAQEIWTLGPVATDSQRLEARAVDPESGDPLVFAHFSATALPLPPSTFIFSENDTIEGYPGEVTSRRSVIQLLNAEAGGIAGAVIHYAVTAGGGSLAADSVITDQFGEAVTPEWTLGAATGVNRISISAAGFAPLTAVATGVKYKAIAGQGTAVCVLTTTNKTRCWGMRWLGIGDTTYPARKWPTPIAPDPGFVTLAGIPSTGGGDQHICGLTAAGAAYCWGYNDHGQIGDGSIQPAGGRAVPTAVAGGHTFASISVGAFSTCGVTTIGKAYCWGWGQFGQLGQTGSDSTGDRSSPSLVSDSLTFTQVSIGNQHACGLVSGGAAYCWGLADGGRLGNGGPETGAHNVIVRPTAVVGGHLFAEIMVYTGMSCGLEAAGDLYCWGANANAGVGDSTMTAKTSPTLVVGGHTFADLAPGHSCALTTGHAAYCWGTGTWGTNGDLAGSLDVRYPIPVSGGHNFDSLWGGGTGTICGLETAGRIWCWGRRLTESTETPTVPPFRVEP